MLTTHVVQMLVVHRGPHNSLMQEYSQWLSLRRMRIQFTGSPYDCLILYAEPFYKRDQQIETGRVLQIKTTWMLFSIVLHVHLLNQIPLSEVSERENDRSRAVPGG